MKTAVLLHGTGGSDTDYFWYADTKRFLESKGYEVWWPLLPNTDKPNLAETSKFVEENMPALNEESIIICHSSSCPLILSMMQNFTYKVRQVVLVAGYYVPQPDGSSSMLPENFDWENIKEKASEIVLINSDNDPWGCDDVQARPVADMLDARFILARGQGHMGSMTYNQPYKEFKMLKDLLAIEVS